MIYFVSTRSTGRSGHKLKDILSLFIFSMLINNSCVLYHNLYSKQFIIDGNSIKKKCVDRKKLKFDKTIMINKQGKWGGITFDDFTKLKMRILNLSKNSKNKNIKVVINEAFRIHPFILHNWFFEKKIDQNLYETKFIPLLHEMYYGNKKANNENVISIHVRRGDIANQMISKGFDYDYYAAIINILNKQFNLPINIYSENRNSDDLHNLLNFKNVKLHLGGQAECFI
jgi:hypothetical protein